jgi:hypothetical protein
MTMINAPFTGEQVQSMNGFQTRSLMHPMTCRVDDCRSVNGSGPMTATTLGWMCRSCDYRQDWTFIFTTDWSWVEHADMIVAALATPMTAKDDPRA